MNRDEMDDPDFLQNLKEGLRQAHHTVRQNFRACHVRQKKTYDLWAREKVYNVGDLVYVRDSNKKKGFSLKLQAHGRVHL